MKCAIIDSGVNNLIIDNNIFGGVTFKNKDNHFEIKKDQYNDENGHGSMVYRTVTRYDVEFYIVKVLNKNNQGNSTILYEALKWLLDVDVKYIIICISTGNNTLKDKYQKIIDELTAQGKIIFSSWTNNYYSINSYPAALRNVISVGRNRDNLKYIECNWEKSIQCTLDMDTSYIWIPNKGFDVFGGNSQATADLLAIVFEKIGYVEDIMEMRNKLEQLQTSYHPVKAYLDGENIIDSNIIGLIKSRNIDFVEIRPMWRIFDSLKEFSIFLEEICNIYEIDKAKVIFRRSMFMNLKIFSNAIIEMK